MKNPLLLAILAVAPVCQIFSQVQISDPYNFNRKVRIISTTWDDHLEISRYGFGALFKPDNSAGYYGLRLDLLGAGSNFYILNGNMGVGVSSPTEAFHVNGNIRMTGTARKLVVGTEGEATDYLQLQDVGTGSSALQWVQDGTQKFGVEGVTGNVSIAGDIRLGGVASKLVVGTPGTPSDYLLLRDIGSGSSAFQWVQDGQAKFSIEGATGNVGIGTVTPGSYKLAVEGKIGAREINVTTAEWPDYVFKEGYRLRSLSEVQQFIRENKHLPDVPSETEVQKNGQDLGAMNAVLLRKIEELTLYIIDLKAQNDQLAQQVQELIRKSDSIAK